MPANELSCFLASTEDVASSEAILKGEARPAGSSCPAIVLTPVLRSSIRQTATEDGKAEEVFANKPLFRKTKKGHYAVFGPTFGRRYLTIVFELKEKAIARPITGWDMKRSEIRYFKKHGT